MSGPGLEEPAKPALQGGDSQLRVGPSAMLPLLTAAPEIELVGASLTTESSIDGVEAWSLPSGGSGLGNQPVDGEADWAGLGAAGGPVGGVAGSGVAGSDVAGSGVAGSGVAGSGVAATPESSPNSAPLSENGLDTSPGTNAAGARIGAADAAPSASIPWESVRIADSLSGDRPESKNIGSPLEAFESPARGTADVLRERAGMGTGKEGASRTISEMGALPSSGGATSGSTTSGSTTHGLAASGTGAESSGGAGLAADPVLAMALTGAGAGRQNGGLNSGLKSGLKSGLNSDSQSDGNSGGTSSWDRATHLRADIANGDEPGNGPAAFSRTIANAENRSGSADADAGPAMPTRQAGAIVPTMGEAGLAAHMNGLLLEPQHSAGSFPALGDSAATGLEAGLIEAVVVEPLTTTVSGDQLLRELRLEVRTGEQGAAESRSIQLEFRERRGEMELLARTGNEEVARAMQETLPELMSRLTGDERIAAEEGGTAAESGRGGRDEGSSGKRGDSRNGDPPNRNPQGGGRRGQEGGSAPGNSEKWSEPWRSLDRRAEEWRTEEWRSEWRKSFGSTRPLEGISA